MTFGDFKEEKATPKKTKEDLIKGGMHVARCYGIVDLGTQKGSDQYPAPKRKVMIMWELPSVKKVFKDGEEAKPCVLKKKYTLSFYEGKARLAIDLESWFSDNQPAGDMAGWLDKHVIGKPAMLNVSQKSFVGQGGEIWYNAIESITPLPDEMKCEDAINPMVKFDMMDDSLDEETFEKLYPWIQDIIKKSPEHNTLTSNYDPKKEADDLPF